MARQKNLGLAHVSERQIEIDFAAHTHEKALLDTVCHEVLHVSSGDFLSETAVENISADLTDVLYRLRYRRMR